MKRKIIYFVFTAILLAALYFCLRFAFGIFTPYNYFTAASDIKSGKIQIIEYGELMLNFDKEQELAKSYGFSFKSIGCVVTSADIKGIKYYNRKMISHLESKYGNGWWNIFEKKIDSVENIQMKERITSEVVSLVANQQSVQEIIKQVDSMSKGSRHIVLFPSMYDTAKNIYLVKVAEDNGIGLVSYFNYFVNSDSMKIINDSLR